MSANPFPATSMPETVHQIHNALTVANARLQRLRRKADRGEVDCAAFLVELDDACVSIMRADVLVDQLARAALVLSVLAGQGERPGLARTDD